MANEVVYARSSGALMRATMWLLASKLRERGMGDEEVAILLRNNYCTFAGLSPDELARRYLMEASFGHHLSGPH